MPTSRLRLKLPSIIRMSINSQINEKLNVGATIDHYRWHECCGDEDGDIAVTLTDKRGNEVGSGDDEVQMSVSKNIYSPRRLWDATNYTSLPATRPTQTSGSVGVSATTKMPCRTAW